MSLWSVFFKIGLRGSSFDFEYGNLVNGFPLFRENWEEYGGRHERTGLGEAVWRSEDPFSFHRLVTHDGADKEAAELMMQAHVVVLFLRLMMVIMVVMMMKQTLSSSGC